MNYFRLFSFAVIATLASFYLILKCVDDFEDGLANVTAAVEESTTILIFGDMMLDRKVRKLIGENGEMYPFENIADDLQNPDITVANLEGVFTSNESISAKNNKILRFTFDKALANTLSDIGFDVLSQANNHTNDFGIKGPEESRETLREVGIETFGDYYNQAVRSVLIEKNGLKISFVGFNEFSYKNFEDVLTAIETAKKESDFVIVMPHWGAEYKRFPNNFQITWAKKFIDAGADVVVGAHPHVIQTVEIYKNKPIFYSLGNFVFDQNFSKETTEGLALKISLHKNKKTFEILPIDIINSKVSWKSEEEKIKTLNWLGEFSNIPFDIGESIKWGKFEMR